MIRSTKDEVALEEVALGLKRIASAILPSGTAAGHDACGGTVDSLTEAVMGITGGLVQIAQALDRLAQAVEDRT